MQAQLVCMLLGLATVVACGRQRDTDDVPEGSAPALTDAPAAAQAEGSGAQPAAEAWQVRLLRIEGRIEREGASQQLLGELLRAGFAESDPRASERALRALSRHLATWRRDWEPVVVDALVEFAAEGREAVWSGVDPRFVIPAIEVLSDEQRWPEVLRLARYYEGSPMEASLAGPRAMAESMLGLRASEGSADEAGGSGE